MVQLIGAFISQAPGYFFTSAAVDCLRNSFVIPSLAFVHACGVAFVTGPASSWLGFSRKQLPRYPASSVYPVFQLKPALYTTVHTEAEGRGHKGLNSDIRLHRRRLDGELLLSVAEPLYAFHRLVA